MPRQPFLSDQLLWPVLLGIAVLCLLPGADSTAGAEDAVAPPGPARVKPPEGAALAQAQKFVRDVYKAQYAKSVPEEREAAIKKFFEDGEKTNDDRAGRYVLFDEARVLALRWGDFELAFAAIDRLEKFYELDGAEMKAAALVAFRAALTQKEAEAAVPLGPPVLEALLHNEKLDLAADLASALADLARRAGLADVAKAMQARRAQIAEMKFESERVKTALASLAKSPDDPAANSVAGKYYALMRGEWTKALPYLAKGNDAALKAAAAKELGRPTEGVEQFALASAWRDCAAKLTGTAKTQVQCHALEWCERALPNLQGLNQRAAESFRDELKAALDSPGAAPSPAGATSFTPGVLAHKEGLIRGIALGDIKEPIEWYSFGGDGRTALVATQQALVLYDLRTGSRRCAITGTLAKGGGAFKVSPDGSQLVIPLPGPRGLSMGNRVYNASSGALVRTLPFKSEDCAYCVGFDASGKGWVLSADISPAKICSLDGTRQVQTQVKLGTYDNVPVGVSCNAATWVCKLSGKDPRNTPAGAPPGLILGYCLDGETGKIKSWLKRPTVDVLPADFPVYEGVLSQNGRYLAFSGGRATFCLFQADKGTFICVLQGPPPGMVRGYLCFSPDGSRLAYAWNDLLIVWQVATGKELLRKTFKLQWSTRGGRNSGMPLSPDGLFGIVLEGDKLNLYGLPKWY